MPLNEKSFLPYYWHSIIFLSEFADHIIYLLNMSRRSDPLDCKVYVGGLPQDATSQELEDAFNRFGRIRKVWVARRPPGFAFVEFEDARDAEDAVKALDGTRICGVRARVEISHGRRRNGGYGGGGGGGGGGYYEGGRRRSRYLEAKRVITTAITTTTTTATTIATTTTITTHLNINTYFICFATTTVSSTVA
uniref:RRM domain-containing protein n=1 Tax=Wuchereria bancrofti TaxID=6293 RepID=A0A1I8EZ27_WUCBA